MSASARGSSMRSHLAVLGIERFLRSVATGYLAVAIPIYVARLAGSPAVAGLALTLAGLISLGSSIAYSAISDVVGHARGLALSEAAFAFALALLSTIRSPWAIAAALGIGGVGMLGPGATRGSFVPQVMAIIRRKSRDPVGRTAELGLINAISTSGGILGSSMAGLLAIEPATVAFAATSLASSALLALTLGREEAIRRTNPFAGVAKRARTVAWYSASQMAAGVGVGLSMPLLSLWMHVYCSLPEPTIGAIFAAGNAAFAVSSLASPLAVRRLGLVRTSALSRFASAALLASMSFVRSAVPLAIVYLLYNATVAIGGTARSSYVSGASATGSEATTPAVAGLTLRIAALPATAIAGYVIDAYPAILMPLAGAFMALAGTAFLELSEEAAR
ncbi:MAG: MFS transporter [Desulfurococcaceae archaeon]